jgi:hypothetical protein
VPTHKTLLEVKGVHRRAAANMPSIRSINLHCSTAVNRPACRFTICLAGRLVQTAFGENRTTVRLRERRILRLTPQGIRRAAQFPKSETLIPGKKAGSLLSFRAQELQLCYHPLDSYVAIACRTSMALGCGSIRGGMLRRMVSGCKVGTFCNRNRAFARGRQKALTLDQESDVSSPRGEMPVRRDLQVWRRCSHLDF